MSTLFLCLLASSRRPFRALKMRFRTAGGGFHAQGAPENASRTIGACFAHRISLPYRRSLFFTPNASENASRTVGGCFAHRISLPYRRRAFPVPSAIEGVGKGSAGDKFRVSGSAGNGGRGRSEQRGRSPQRQAAAAAELRTSRSRRVRDFHQIGYVRSGRTKKEADL